MQYPRRNFLKKDTTCANSHKKLNEFLWLACAHNARVHARVRVYARKQCAHSEWGKVGNSGTRGKEVGGN